MIDTNSETWQRVSAVLREQSLIAATAICAQGADERTADYFRGRWAMANAVLGLPVADARRDVDETEDEA